MKKRSRRHGHQSDSASNTRSRTDACDRDRDRDPTATATRPRPRRDHPRPAMRGMCAFARVRGVRCEACAHAWLHAERARTHGHQQEVSNVLVRAMTRM
jgi:hypothetical protein